MQKPLYLLAALALVGLPALAHAVDLELPASVKIADLVGDQSLASIAGAPFQIIPFEARDQAGHVIAHPEHRLLVQGGLHGNETTAQAFVMWVARRYAHGQSALNQLPRDKVAVDF